MASSFNTSSNPVLARGFDNVQRTGTDVMTMRGTITKTAAMVALVAVAAATTWNAGGAGLMLLWPSLIVGFVLALVIAFKPKTAPFLGPVYALVEGVLVGGISLLYATGQVFDGAGGPGLIFGAVTLTFGIFTAMLVLYATGLVRATKKFRTGVMAATLGVMVYYLLSIVLRMFGVEAPLIWSNGTLGILFTGAIVVLAALNLVLDFDFVERGVEARLPKHMEWYGAFGLTVTLVWLYIEVLRLLSKLQSRD